MKDNNKAKLLTVGIAVVLILIVCGISVIIYALNKRNSQDTNTMLQEDIMEYANASQQQSVTAQDIEKQDSIPKETEKSEEAEKKEEPEKQEEKEVTAEEEPAVVVEEQEETQEQSIMEEEAGKQDSEEGQKKTAKWQKEAGEDLAAVEIDLSRQMSEMKGYWEAGNMAAVEDLAYLPRYRAASEKLSGTTKYYYYGDTDESKRPNGMGLAMYTDSP